MATPEVKINNEITGKNKGELTRWFTLDELESLVQTADPGDLLEMDCVTYKHWLIYAGVDRYPAGHAEVGKKEAIEKETGEQEAGEKEPFVVHFDNETQQRFRSDKSMAQIRKHPLKKVLSSNKKVRINNALDRRICLVSPAADISLVNQRIDEFVKEKKSYHMFHRNCEHFANFCRYGGKISNQSRLIPVWVTIVILCLSGLQRFSSTPTVTLLRTVTKRGVLPQYLGAQLAYGLAVIRVLDLLTAFCMMFSFVKNTLFSISREMRTAALIFATFMAYFTEDPVEAQKMELGPGSSYAGLGVLISAFVVCSVFSPRHLLKKLSWIVGFGLPIFVLGPKFSATLFLMMYMYEVIRMSHLGTTNSFDFFNFTVVVAYLDQSYGMVFPIFLVVAIIVDDIIRLKFAAYQGKLNFVASILLFSCLILLFGCLHATILIAICVAEQGFSQIQTRILGDGTQRIRRQLNFSGWTSGLHAYCWQYFSVIIVILVSVITVIGAALMSQSIARRG